MEAFELAVDWEETESFIFGWVYRLLFCARVCPKEGVAASLGSYILYCPCPVCATVPTLQAMDSGGYWSFSLRSRDLLEFA